MKILCVDDSSITRNAVSHEIEKLGYEIELEADAFGAGDKIRKNFYDIIFLDINMPGKTGLELLEELAQEGVKYGTVVILTTETSAESKKRGKALGVKAWAIKPLQQGAASTLIKKLVENA